VLVVGSGGREHALVHRLSQSSLAPRLRSYPGNPGIHQLASLLAPSDDSARAIAATARSEGVDLVVVGPEAYLAAGLVDACIEAGIAAFGPTRRAARIETSKAWAKDIMQRARVPTAAHHTFTDTTALREYLRAGTGTVVVKADGIAAGKGVLVSDDRSALVPFGEEYLRQGNSVLVEEYLSGPEVSLFALVCDTAVLPLACARDYKRALDGDEGPNTGGMGAISPPDLPSDFLKTMTNEIIRPVALEMVRSGSPFRGVLYAGLMLTEAGPKVLEFNARFGDPETQVILPLLRSDLLPLLANVARGDLSETHIEPSPSYACGVTIASAGYPGTRATPRTCTLGSVPAGSVLYHAGTALGEDEQLQAVGGRVFTAVGQGDSLPGARARAYELAAQVGFEGAWFRTDIGAQ
jgi:phosphoribosylamine--glycine ligase